eukprot:gene1971-1479_t
MRRINSSRNVNERNGLFNPDEEFNQTPNNLLEAYRRVLKELHLMKLQLKNMKEEFNDGFEHGISQWSSKYSRRLLIFSSVFLSIYVFIEKLNEIYFGPSFFLKKLFLKNFGITCGRKVFVHQLYYFPLIGYFQEMNGKIIQLYF